MKRWLPFLIIIGLLVYYRRVNMGNYCFRQLEPASDMDANEYAKTICMRNGKIFWGSEAKGEPMSVRLRPSCPDGEAIGIVHSHPSGTSEPSQQDISEMLRAKLPWLCVHGEDALRCYRIERQ
jgi:proteasome lid subunit RPN8/RPN11